MLRSFANASGGDLVFGMEENQGIPTKIVGLSATDLDLEQRRLDSMLAAGVNPRIRYETRIVSTRAGQRVLVLRVERSWSGPHRVVFQGHDKFYGRNSAGKYPLDVNELRAAFTLSATVIERIQAFRVDRIISLSRDETPLPCVKDPKVLLHCIPIDSFVSRSQYDVLPLYGPPLRLPPIGSQAYNRRLNLEGVLSFDLNQPSHAYTQIYRNGTIEVFNGEMLTHVFQGQRVISSTRYEKALLDYLPDCLQVQQQMGAVPPVVVALTLIGTRGLTVYVDRGFPQPGERIASDTIVLPEAVLEDLSIPAGRALKPMFDLVWNACGFASSPNFDADGNWVSRRY